LASHREKRGRWYNKNKKKWGEQHSPERRKTESQGRVARWKGKWGKALRKRKKRDEKFGGGVVKVDAQKGEKGGERTNKKENYGIFFPNRSTSSNRRKKKRGKQGVHKTIHE